MNKEEVILTIQEAGTEFSKIMEAIREPEYAAGYYQAIRDMAKLISYAPLDADFDAERERLTGDNKRLKEENKELRRRVECQQRLIGKLLTKSKDADLLGVKIDRGKR